MPKPILGKWITGQSKLKGLGFSLSKKLGLDLKQAMGMGPYDDLVASTSSGVSTAISQPRAAIPTLIPGDSFPLSSYKGLFIDSHPQPELVLV